uniref:GIY-YIG domain-containing protein n=1 Tax=Nuclearia simplex TaxID=154970 RepID=M1JZP0_9EUKA|nr:hypothetical protein H891_mgp40 [Nuclearia simplex]AGE93647.1 hypothetical protein [Nuclearia simplex]
MIKIINKFYEIPKTLVTLFSTLSSPSSPSPVIVYHDVASHKASIVRLNNNKSGIYCWVNLINGKTYIGSSLNLGSRLRDYFKHSFLIHPKNNKLLIYKAILKYGYSNFKLEILEYCDVSVLIEREQYYIDTFKPSYNILTVAYSSLGFKHSEESLSKLRSHLSILNQETAFKVHVTDIVNNTTTVYDSVRKAALALNTDLKSLKYHENKKSPKKPFKGRFLINIIRH